MRGKGVRISSWKGICFIPIHLRRNCRLKIENCISDTRFLCAFNHKKSMRLWLEVLLKSAKFEEEFKSFRCECF